MSKKSHSWPHTGQEEGMDDKPRPIPLPWVLKLFRRLDFPHKLGFLDRIYGAFLSRKGTVHVCTSNGVIWKLDLSDQLLRWIVYGDYEGTEGLSWMRSWLSRGGVVIDSGANLGQYLLFLAPLPSVRVIAFEPLPVARDWLCHCLRYQRGWDVSVFPEGLFDKSGTKILRQDGARSTLRTDWYQNKGLEEHTIDVIRLDEALCRQGCERVRLWKLDVEGEECAALRGASTCLEAGSIEAIFLEVSPETAREATEYLLARLYRLYLPVGRGRLIPFTGIPAHTMNIVAIHTGANLR